MYGVKYRGHTLMIGEKVPMGASLVLVAGDGKSDEDLDIVDNPIDRPAGEDTTAVEEDPWF